MDSRRIPSSADMKVKGRQYARAYASCACAMVHGTEVLGMHGMQRIWIIILVSCLSTCTRTNVGVLSLVNDLFTLDWFYDSGVKMQVRNLLLLSLGYCSLLLGVARGKPT